MNRRTFFTRLVPVAAATLAAAPALAQDMGENGMAIPSFFFSGAERRAREACENRDPSCRPDVRRDMSFEKQVSLLFPWVGLALGLVVILIYARKREQDRERKRRLAQARHVPGGHKHQDHHKPHRDDRDDRDNADDRF